jgi:hypothetical protein
MSPTRREFIQRFGIALASLAMARCVRLGGSRRRGADAPRERLRDCWLRFEWLAEKANDWENPKRGEKALEELTADHRQALDELVAAGDLDASVAEQVQVAFDAAAYHIWRANMGATCYEPVIVDYVPGSSSRLVQQAALLAEMADDGDISPHAVAQAQAAVERDVAFLNMPYEARDALYDEIAKHLDERGVPPLVELDLEVTPDAAQAARFLVALLSGG